MLPNDTINYTASWTQICNRALGRLGAGTVTDLAEGTANAEICGRFLPEAVEHVLSQWDFKCCRKRASPAMNAERPLSGWQYAFTLPVDFLRLVEARDGDWQVIPFQIESGNILSDGEEMRIVYTARPSDPNALPASVREAVSTRLAYLLSTAITSNEQLIALTMAEAQQAVEKAKKEDGQLNFDPNVDGESFHAGAR